MNAPAIPKVRQSPKSKALDLMQRAYSVLLHGHKHRRTETARELVHMAKRLFLEESMKEEMDRFFQPHARLLTKGWKAK